ncbi:MAG: hypothetical protein IKA42_05045 [Clostridia bacterium]|nr:hypothetical protein [Clostridia bacterium]
MQNKENKTNEPEAKKTQAKKDTDNNTKKQQTKSQNKQKQPAKKAKQQKEKTTEQNINAKPSLIKRVFSSMAFWTFLLVIGFAMIGFGLFGKTAQPAQAKSSLQQTDEIRYGTSGEVALQLDKKVSFDGGEVVWYVDGIEAKRGSATQSKSFVLKHSFDSVGTHKVRAEVAGYPNLTCETDVVVKKPLLVIEVSDETKIYGDQNPVAKYSVSGFVDNDTMQSLKLATPQFNATNESPVGEYGIKPITHEKYDVMAKGGKLVVQKKLLSVKSNNGTKIYDGTTKVDDLQFNVGGKVGDDEVFIEVQSANYVDKNVGKNKGIKITKANLLGSDAKNYCLPKEIVASGQIVCKNISLQQIDVADKFYDGGTAVTFENLGQFEGLASGDDVGISQIVARFETASVGKQKRVIVDKILLSGKDAKNYVIELPQNLVAQIKGESKAITSNEIKTE